MAWIIYTVCLWHTSGAKSSKCTKLKICDVAKSIIGVELELDFNLVGLSAGSRRISRYQAICGFPWWRRTGNNWWNSGALQMQGGGVSASVWSFNWSVLAISRPAESTVYGLLNQSVIQYKHKIRSTLMMNVMPTFRKRHNVEAHYHVLMHRSMTQPFTTSSFRCSTACPFVFSSNATLLVSWWFGSIWFIPWQMHKLYKVKRAKSADMIT